MTSPEIKEKTQMSMEALQKRITALEQENRRLKHMITDIGRKADDSSRQCSRLDYLLNNRIEEVLSKVPIDFWKKILVSVQQKREIGETGKYDHQKARSKDNSKDLASMEGRLEGDTEIPEDLHQQDARSKDKSKDLKSMEGQLEGNTETSDLYHQSAKSKDNSKDLASMEGLLEDETEKPDLYQQHAMSKDKSKDPMSMEGQLEDETEKPDLYQQHAMSKDKSKDPMSMEGQLEDETEKPDLYQQHAMSKDKSKDPMSMEGQLEADSKDLASMEGLLEGETEMTKDLYQQNERHKGNSKQFESALLSDASKDKDHPKQYGINVSTSNLQSTEATKAKKNEAVQQKKSSTMEKTKKFFDGFKGKGNSGS